MSVQAVGGYIDALLKQRPDMTAARLAEQAGVQNNYIWRLRSGSIDAPSARVIMALVSAVGGDLDLAASLLLDSEATVDDGERAAHAQQRRLDPRYQRALERLNDKELDAIIEFVERLQGSR